MWSKIQVTLYLNKKLLPHLRSNIRLVIGVLALTSAVSCHRGNEDDLIANINTRWVAHALGGYQGKSYLNCRECFDSNLLKGYQLFEMGFMMTTDNHMAGIHDGQEAEFGLPASFSLSQFKSSSIQGTTPLSDIDVAELARDHRDWYLVTDIKSNNLDGLKALCRAFDTLGVSCFDRVIPQFYFPDELKILNELPFKRSIFTMYKFGNQPDQLLKLIDSYPQLWAVTMWADWWNDTYRQNLAERKVIGFVHTVNDPTKAKDLLNAGVTGIYTDFLDDRSL